MAAEFMRAKDNPFKGCPFGRIPRLVENASQSQPMVCIPRLSTSLGEVALDDRFNCCCATRRLPQSGLLMSGVSIESERSEPGSHM
jgi:hypothetical protein